MGYIEKRLKYRPNGACRVRIYSNNEIHLVSYATVVLKAEPVGDKFYISPAGEYYDGERIYTPTSARHISCFLKEYFPSLTYPQFKLAAEKTGEIFEEELAEGVSLYA